MINSKYHFNLPTPCTLTSPRYDLSIGVEKHESLGRTLNYGPLAFHGHASSGVFTVATATYQPLERVDQEVLQRFCCAEAHPFSQVHLQVLSASLNVF